MNTLRAAIFAALFVSNTALAVAAGAEDITLRTEDGAVELTGALLGFDGAFYRIDTEYGVLTVDGARVRCDGAACPTPGAYVARVTLSGDRVMARSLLPELIEAYAVQAGHVLTPTDPGADERLFRLDSADTGSPVAEIILRSSTTTDGLVDMVSNQADIVLARREVTPGESAIATDAGLGDFQGPYQVRVLARDALVPVVHAANAVRHLDVEALMNVFSGEVETWSDLGGGDAPIALHLAARDAEPDAAFSAQVFRATGAPLSPAVVTHPTAEALLQALSRDPSAIGVLPFSETGGARVLPLAGACGFDITADAMSIMAGDYPLTLPLYLYLPERRLPDLARDFLAFLYTPEAQAVVQRSGYVGQDFTATPLDRQGGRLARAIGAAGPEVTLNDLQRMIPLFAGRERLSLTFRFLDGSTTLDPTSRANVAFLAAAFEAGRFDGQIVSFAGFSDGSGPAGANLRLSERRADLVRTAVLSRVRGLDPARVTIETQGFGEALPMACDDTSWGRQVNRRVEVWVGPGPTSE